MAVTAWPPRLGCSNLVSFDSRKGITCVGHDLFGLLSSWCRLASLAMHSDRKKRLLLMCLPSSTRSLQFSNVRSAPARSAMSIRASLIICTGSSPPSTSTISRDSTMSVSSTWDRLLSSFQAVAETRRNLSALCMARNVCAAEVTIISVAPSAYHPRVGCSFTANPSHSSPRRMLPDLDRAAASKSRTRSLYSSIYCTRAKNSFCCEVC
mmetsp:Transcript_32734/g.84898  ORF Transcript_32734/g.84898 Transcript_32734/m.84898 type:complete len:209 (+) Transcript_32734:468-1094(+)